MTQGTKSILFGCHSIIHSLLVVIAWRRLYGTWPRGVTLKCIFIHDIGHIGLHYLDSAEAKRQHWRLGARLAQNLWGDSAFLFLAGHCSDTGYERSLLYKADKYSWYIAPTWWLWWNNMVEPELTINCKGNMDAVRKFQAMVKTSIESGEYRSTHQIYLERKGCEKWE